MLVHDPPGNCQSQAGATGRSVVRPPEAFKKPGQILGLDAGALIVDLQEGSTQREERDSRLRPHQDRDRGPGRAVADGVVDEDGDKLAKPHRIARYPVSYTHLTLPTIYSV